MATRVLVAYGTKNGSTAGIADMIADELTAAGIDVQVQPAAQVRSVDGYDAVVLGGALYTGRWHRDARRFAHRYAGALRDRPVWVFSSGPLDDSADASEIPAVAQAGRAVRELNSRPHVTFGGRLSENATGLIARAMVRNGRAGDFRNPERIRRWSRSIAAALRPAAGDSTLDPNDGGDCS